MLLNDRVVECRMIVYEIQDTARVEADMIAV